MKENKGITLISLIVTLIVMSIIATITVTTMKKDNNTVNETKSSMKEYELHQIQQTVFENYIKYIQTKNEEYLVGTQCTNVSQLTQYENELDISFKDTAGEGYKNYYYLDNDEALNKLGITGTKDRFIVNYKTGEVFNYTAKKNKTGEVLYISN